MLVREIPRFGVGACVCACVHICTCVHTCVCVQSPQAPIFVILCSLENDDII